MKKFLFLSSALLALSIAPHINADGLSVSGGTVAIKDVNGVQPDFTAGSPVKGSVAAGAPPTDPPIYIGCQVLTTIPSSYTTVTLQPAICDAKGRFGVFNGFYGSANNYTGGVDNADGQTSTGNAQNLIVNDRLTAYNNTSWDRLYTAPGAAAKGNAGLGVLAVEEAGRTFSNITTATTATVKSGKGFFHTLTLNTFIASATITIYDNTTGSGTKIATLTLPSTITGDAPITLTYDIAFATGLTIVTSGATDITATYR